MSYVHEFLFGIYPYLCLAVFFVGSLIRFDREQYTWKSDSSQLLSRRQLRWGSNLFHIGILGIFFGHFVGLLTPVDVWHAVGVSAPAKQMLAIVAGGIFGVICFVGLALLIHRRLTVARIRATTKPMDLIVLGLILVQLALGLVSLSVSWAHRDGGEMVKLMTWAQHIVTFRGDAASFVVEVVADLQAAPPARHDDLPRLPVLAAGSYLERLRLARLSRAPVPGGAGP